MLSHIPLTFGIKFGENRSSSFWDIVADGQTDRQTHRRVTSSLSPSQHSSQFWTGNITERNKQNKKFLEDATDVRPLTPLAFCPRTKWRDWDKTACTIMHVILCLRHFSFASQARRYKRKTNRAWWPRLKHRRPHLGPLRRFAPSMGQKGQKYFFLFSLLVAYRLVLPPCACDIV